MSSSRVRRWLGRLLLVGASSLVSLVALELALRATWSGYYLKDAEPYAEPDPARGWRNRADVVVEYGEPEFKITIRQNQWGFRGAPLERAKGPRRRVLVMGDSFTYGVGVEDDETFSARLGQLEPNLEVINTGANGYGTGQELLLLRDEGLAFEPDVVLLAFFWNDLANNVERPDVLFQLRDGRIVYPPRREGLPAVSSEPRRHPWLRHSYAYRFGSDRIKTLRFWVKSRLGMPLVDDSQLTPEERDARWDLERALVREIRDLCRAAGAELLIVMIPDQVQVEPDARAQVVGLDEADYEVQDRMLAIARDEGIAVLDLLPALRAEHERTGAPLYYRQDRHFLPRAHEIAASEIRNTLEDLGWIEAGDPGVPAREAGSPPVNARGG